MPGRASVLVIGDDMKCLATSIRRKNRDYQIARDEKDEMNTRFYGKYFFQRRRFYRLDGTDHCVPRHARNFETGQVVITD